jgi:hypothetical protein
LIVVILEIIKIAEFEKFHDTTSQIQVTFWRFRNAFLYFRYLAYYSGRDSIMDIAVGIKGTSHMILLIKFAT